MADHMPSCDHLLGEINYIHVTIEEKKKLFNPSLANLYLLNFIPTIDKINKVQMCDQITFYKKQLFS